MGLLGGGDDLGVEAACGLGDTGHDALHVDEHRLHGPGGDGQLLLQEGTGDGQASSHEDLVGGAADACDVDAVGALLLDLLLHGWIVGHIDDGLGQRRLVPVQEDVDLIIAEDAEVDVGPDGCGRAEEDVLQVGGDHRAAPAVCERTAHAAQDHGLVVGIDTHVGAMHDVDDLAVDAPGVDLQLLPVLDLLRGCPFDELDAVLLRAERSQAGLGDLLGDLQDRLAVTLDAQLVGQGVQLVLVLDLVAGRLSSSRLQQQRGHRAAVVGVGRRTGSHVASKAPRRNGVDRRATHADLRPVAPGQTQVAGPQVADRAADARLADLALGAEGGVAIPDRLDAL